jgi:hypothetical protein
MSDAGDTRRHDRLAACHEDRATRARKAGEDRLEAGPRRVGDAVPVVDDDQGWCALEPGAQPGVVDRGRCADGAAQELDPGDALVEVDEQWIAHGRTRDGGSGGERKRGGLAATAHAGEEVQLAVLGNEAIRSACKGD